MFRIRRFAVVRTANTVAVMYVVALLIVVVPVALILVATTPAQDGPAGVVTALVTPLLALMIAIVYGLLAWVFTALACLLYNLTSRFTGGIAVEAFRDVPPMTATSAPPPAGPQPSPYG